MKHKERIEALAVLGEAINDGGEWLDQAIVAAYRENSWFTPENSKKAIAAIQSEFLQPPILEDWSARYQITDSTAPKTIGLVLAGNIPLVGFHDVLCTFVSGHQALIKSSSKDSVLLRAIIRRMIQAFPESDRYFKFSEKLKGFDAIIATGSNNSARYFEQYFGKYPHIIRKNRSGVGVLHGDESKEDFKDLGTDIFSYFGLGCRNVSKIYVPKGYVFDELLETLHEEYKEVIHHNKYKNNFDYNNALFLLNKVKFLMSGSLILTECEDIISRIATLHYEPYEDIIKLALRLESDMEQIQCVVSAKELPGIKTFALGHAQRPAISDFADGVDTMKFLNSL